MLSKNSLNDSSLLLYNPSRVHRVKFEINIRCKSTKVVKIFFFHCQVLYADDLTRQAHVKVEATIKGIKQIPDHASEQYHKNSFSLAIVA